MNKKYIIAIIVIVLIAIGVALFFTKKSEAPGQAGEQGLTQDAAKTGQSADTMSNKKTLKELFAQGGANQTCTFESGDATAKTSGTVYIKGAGDQASMKMRGDFETVTDGKTMKSHMIVDGQTSYVWTDEMKQGFKMSFEKATEQQTGQTSRSVNPNEAYDYKCTSGVASESVFALPAGITFSAMPSFGANASGSAGVNLKVQQCAACAQISDPTAQAQCKATLNCQ